MTNLVIQSYGADNEFRRAVMAIWSFYVYWPRPIEETRVVLFTDNPDFFKRHLGSLPVTYSVITPEKLKVMRGAIDFVHRVKIAAIEEAFTITTGDILYIDSDTFFIADPLPYMQRLSNRDAFMHVAEYDFDKMPTFELPGGKTFHIFHEYVMNRPFTLTTGEQLYISPKQISWNAGVILLHRSHEPYLADVYKLTEDFYPDTKNHGCEQYAFSIVLDRKAKVSGCFDMVYHYWWQIKKKVADKFLLPRITGDWALRDDRAKLVDIRQWTLELPKVFEDDVMMIKWRALQDFNINQFARGYSNTLKGMMREPFDKVFIRHVLYHTRRFLRVKFLNKS